MQGNGCRLLAYNRDTLEEKTVCDARELSAGEGKIYWLDYGTLEDEEGIKAMAAGFGIHHLIVEDILNSGEMVKMDNFDDCLFLVLKMLNLNRGSTNITTEHVSIVLRGSFVISFQEKDSDIFKRVRERLKSGQDSIRRLGADYLCYELVDTVVDDYFVIIDELSEVIDELEEELIAKPEKSTLQKIYFVKQKLMYLRKSVFPLREVIGSLSGSRTGQITDSVRIYYRDVYDHLIQIVDSIETYQDILSNMLDIYLSSISNRTNDTMKILTIFSTIFIPLTFLCGVYGMNFENIPLLSFRYGYYVFWGVSVIIAGIMLLFFHKKKWL